MSEKDTGPSQDPRPSTDELLDRLSTPAGPDRVRALVGEFTDSGERLRPVDWSTLSEREVPLRLVVWRWLQLLAFDLATVAACGLVAVKAGHWPALGTCAAFTSTSSGSGDGCRARRGTRRPVTSQGSVSRR
ncbi:hypothetical protein [Streptomyces sp. YGL11-2]|uniref:hypothetical protein n=1 Tax=Streptomyces sp. YGL11-2 TaxID=3414028 RepID=UPI003CF64816